MTPFPSLATLIETVLVETPDEDPMRQLALAAESARELEQLGDELLDHFVERCRGDGRSWSEISSVLGVSKQAAHKRFALGRPALERFTPRAREVIADAPERARMIGDAFVGTEHLLLALFAPAEAIAAQVLAEAGLTPALVAAELAERRSAPRPATAPAGRVGYTPRAVSALRLAEAAALRLGHSYVGTEHLLLGLFDEADGLAARLLETLGVTRADILRRLEEKLAAIKRAREAGPVPDAPGS